MAFQLRADESVPDGLRRLARKKLKSARIRLTESAHPSDEAIHEARKSVKKVRAILNIAEGDGGRHLKAARTRLRSVNRTLSKLRDADAMLEILTKVKDRDSTLFDEHTFARLRRDLSTRKRRTQRDAERDDAFEVVVSDLKKTRRAVRKWQVDHQGYGSLWRGIRATYRRGRRALARARRKPQAANFHEWRKQLKTLNYDLRLLVSPGPSIGRDIKALHEAESALGDDHNLVVLCTELSKSDACRNGAFDLIRVRRSVERYQRELRRQAMVTAAGIYDRKPREYVREIKQACHRSHRRSQQTPPHRRRQRAS